MKTSFTLGTGLLALLLSLTGCQAETTEAGLPEEFDFEKSQEQPEEIDVIRIWAPSDVSNALLGVSLLFEKNYGVDIQFTDLQLAEIESRLESSNYPDVFFGPHSWNADLAKSGVVSKLRTDVLAESIPQNLRDAFAFEEDYYGVPMSAQHVALVCNSELISEQPSFEDLQEFGLGLGLDNEIDYPYHLHSVMSSFGLSLKDPQTTQFDSDSGYEFASWMSSEGSKLFDLNSDYSSTLAAFNEEQIGCWLTSPRSIGSINSELQDTLVVYPPPALGNAQSEPLLDVAGFYVAADSDDPVYANRLVLEYFTRVTTQVAVANSLSGVPAVETDDELFSMFRDSAMNATSTPSSELMDYLRPLLGATQAELLENEVSSEEIWAGFVSELDALRANQD